MANDLPRNSWAHAVFDGTRPFDGDPTSSVKTLKLYLVAGGAKPELRHMIRARDVGIRDGQDPDPFGHACKCPPGDYIAGSPEACATRHSDGTIAQNNADDAAYGMWFTPLLDGSPSGGMAQHGRAGIGVHGGGSDLANPFALNQSPPWEFTSGCIRLVNLDNEYTWVPFVRAIQAAGGHVLFTVYWGNRA